MTEYLHGDRDRDGPSKTAAKREMLAVQDLGGELLKLSGAQLDGLGMDPVLREALREHGRMPTREARRRHMQYIGRLLRERDTSPLQAGLDEIHAGSKRVLAEAESWRLRLLEEASAMTEWINRHPDTEVQALRNLVRNARREQDKLAEAIEAGGQPQRPAAKKLLLALREQLQRAHT